LKAKKLTNGLFDFLIKKSSYPRPNQPGVIFLPKFKRKGENPMKPREPTYETEILRCPDALDCAECAAAVECLSEILSALTPEQRNQILGALCGDAP
jgi:hypothetical protein